MNLKELADSIYVISLPDRVDRREALEKDWAKQGLTTDDFFYIDGVVPERDTILWNEMRCFEAEGNPANLRNEYVIGAVGCKRAWIKVLKIFLYSFDNTALICEDDCRWDSDTNEVLSKLESFPDGWEIIYLGCRHKINPDSVGGGWAKLNAARLTTAMIFNKDSARRLIAELEKTPFEVDVYLERCHKDKIKAYCPADLVARQGASKSSISQIKR